MKKIKKIAVVFILNSASIVNSGVSNWSGLDIVEPELGRDKYSGVVSAGFLACFVHDYGEGLKVDVTYELNKCNVTTDTDGS